MFFSKIFLNYYNNLKLNNIGFFQRIITSIKNSDRCGIIINHLDAHFIFNTAHFRTLRR